MVNPAHIMLKPGKLNGAPSDRNKAGWIGRVVNLN